SSAIRSLQAVLLYSRYAAASPCDAQVPRAFCIVRLLGTSAVPSFVVVHTSINALRWLSAFNVSAHRQSIVTRVLLGGSLTYAIVYGFIVFWAEPLNGRAPYCTSLTKES
ncbi:hypothetical protein PMAYCL1PPCAC_10041, partial [Pristionchus mayeri]